MTAILWGVIPLEASSRQPPLIMLGSFVETPPRSYVGDDSAYHLILPEDGIYNLEIVNLRHTYPFLVPSLPGNLVDRAHRYGDICLTSCVINAQRLLASIYMVLALFDFVEFEMMAPVFPVRAKVIM